MPDILSSAQDHKLLPPSQVADPVLDNLNLPYSARGGELPKEPEPIPIIPPPTPKKGHNKAMLITLLLFLFATLPLMVLFTSQQRQIADIRKRAASPGNCWCDQGGKVCMKEDRSIEWKGHDSNCGQGLFSGTPSTPAPSQSGSGAGGGSPSGGGEPATPPTQTAPAASAGATCGEGVNELGACCGDGLIEEKMIYKDCSRGTRCTRSWNACKGYSGGITTTGSTTTGGTTGSGTTTAPPSAQVTPIPDTFQGGEGSCDPGANTPDHIYNQCCGEGLSKRVIRSCTNAGKFVYAVGACDQQDNACKTSTGGSTVCPNKEDVYVNGQCYKANAGGCTPNCSGKACGANDGCSGVCTESCGSQGEADRVSAQGPTGGGIINAGNANSDACNNTTGACQTSSGQTLQLCSCDTPSVGPQAAQCNQNCRPVSSGSASCQSEADRSCKTVQLDVMAGGQLVDTIVCNPSNPSACGGGGAVGGGGGGGTPQTQTEQPPPASTPTPTPTPTPIAGPQCRNVKLYRNNEVVTPSDLRPGDQVTVAIAGANATKARARVNGGTWVETTTTNAAGEYTIQFVIPSAGGTFTIEAEVHQNGVWK